MKKYLLGLFLALAVSTGAFADALSTMPGQRIHQGGLVLPQQGGTGLNTRTSSGVLQFNSGTASVSAALANGTTATTQSINDGSTKVDTTSYADRAAATINQNSQSAAYTTVLADAGKQIFHPSTDANARTFTIDSNANVPYITGTAITFINMSANNVTIAITTDTLYWSPTGTTGSRTLAQYGVATAVKIDSTHWIISGSGLSYNILNLHPWLTQIVGTA